MIDVDGLSKRYGRIRALDDVTFRVGRGEVVGLLGHNGAGKTTCIRLLTGFLPPSAGSASVDGLDCVGDSLRARSRVGYLPEAAPVYPEMRVRDYLRFRAALHGLRGAARRSAIDRSVERCWLTEVRSRRIGQLSKGFRQRVGLASAILADPPALILDEPTSGLDPSQIAETRRLVRDLASDKAVLLSSHILSEVEATCDRVLVLARGRLRLDSAIGSIDRSERGPARHVVEIQGTPEDAKALLADAGAGEGQAESLAGGWTRATFSAEDDLREPIAGAAAQRGLRVRELHRESPTLERLFMRLMAQEHEEASAREARP